MEKFHSGLLSHQIKASCVKYKISTGEVKRKRDTHSNRNSFTVLIQALTCIKHIHTHHVYW